MEGLCTKILVTRRSLRKMMLKRRQVEAGRLAAGRCRWTVLASGPLGFPRREMTALWRSISLHLLSCPGRAAVTMVQATCTCRMAQSDEAKRWWGSLEMLRGKSAPLARWAFPFCHLFQGKPTLCQARHGVRWAQRE